MLKARLLEMNSPRHYLCPWKIQFCDWGNPLFGTLVGYPGFPGLACKWVCYGHISGHQLHRFRNSVLMHSKLTGFLRAELQEPHSRGTENKIKDMTTLICLQTKLVIRKAHTQEKDGIDRREVEGSKRIFHTSQDRQIKYLRWTIEPSVNWTEGILTTCGYWFLFQYL